MTIGPNEDGADKLQEYHESIPCPTCGAKESEYARLITRVKELEGAVELGEKVVQAFEIFVSPDGDGTHGQYIARIRKVQYAVEEYRRRAGKEEG